MPMLATGGGLFFLSPDGIIDAATAANASALSGADATPAEDQLNIGEIPQTETGKPTPEVVQEASEDETDTATEEVKKFLKWVRKGRITRPFNFEAIDPDYAEVLNKYISIGDRESAKWYAERYIGL
jgi:hypothetical protein